MNEEKALDFIRELLTAYRKKPPTAAIVRIVASTWLAMIYLVGKPALLLAIPIFLVAICKAIE